MPHLRTVPTARYVRPAARSEASFTPSRENVTPLTPWLAKEEREKPRPTLHPTGRGRYIAPAMATPRIASTRCLLSLLLASGLLWLPGLAHAQDEFDDEFDDEPAPTQSEPPYETFDHEGALRDGDGYQEAHRGDDADDGFDDVGVDDSGIDDASAEPEARDDAARERRFQAQPTVDGPSGGVHVEGAGSGPAGSFRFQLAFMTMRTKGWLRPGDRDDLIGGSLSLGITASDHVEVYGALLASANTNNFGTPPLLIVLGDVVLGTKVFTDIRPGLTLGGDVSLRLPTAAGTGPSFSDLGVGLRANLSADLRERHDPIPLIIRTGLGYVFDGTAPLARGTERARYDVLEGAAPRAEETRNLITAEERYGLGISRVDRMELGIGFELPLTPREDIVVSPMLEWQWAIPVNRRGYNCPYVPGAEGDSCLSNEGAASWPMDLTLGVRVLPVVRGLSATLAMEIGLTGTKRGHAVRELPQNEPWRLWAAVSWAYEIPDESPPEVIEREVVERVEIPYEPPVMGRVHGFVVEEGSLSRIPGAIISLPDHPELSSLVSGPDGQFTTYLLPPGEVRMDLMEDSHGPAGCVATIPEEGGEVSVRCELPAPLVAVEESEVVVLEQVHFALDSDEILPSSFALIEQVARTLNGHAEIAHVEIQGHTDDQGAPEHNLDLSARRAASVRRWLVEHGVTESRLSARGYGMTRPIAPGTSEEARARNRRVEFHILDRAP